MWRTHHSDGGGGGDDVAIAEGSLHSALAAGGRAPADHRDDDHVDADGRNCMCKDLRAAAGGGVPVKVRREGEGCLSWNCTCLGHAVMVLWVGVAAWW